MCNRDGDGSGPSGDCDNVVIMWEREELSSGSKGGKETRTC